MSTLIDNTVLIGGPEKREISIAQYDPSWQTKYLKHEDVIRNALGDKLLNIEHVGSTAVPGLGAKPIIDIDVVLADSGDEASYLPALEAAGYVLRVREPDWHEHRMMRTPALDVHIHIFTLHSPEVERHLIFRDRLRSNAADRKLYDSTKRMLAEKSWDSMDDYANAKTNVVERIIASALEVK